MPPKCRVSIRGWMRLWVTSEWVSEWTHSTWRHLWAYVYYAVRPCQCPKRRRRSSQIHVPIEGNYRWECVHFNIVLVRRTTGIFNQYSTHVINLRIKNIDIAFLRATLSNSVAMVGWFHSRTVRGIIEFCPVIELGIPTLWVWSKHDRRYKMAELGVYRAKFDGGESRETDRDGIPFGEWLGKRGCWIWWTCRWRCDGSSII